MAPTQSPTPVRFDYDEDHRALTIEWSTGEIDSVPFDVLRKGCPCAVCSGELGSRGRFGVKPDLDPGEDELADLALVGAYGINLRWADGHDTGIYTYEQLYRFGHHEMSDE